MSTVENKNSNKLDKKIIDILVVTAILLGFRILPAPGALTATGMLVIGCFISVLYSWVMRSGGWLSLLVFCYYCMSSGVGYTQSMASALGNANVMVLIFALCFVGAMRETGLTNFMANKILSLGFVKKGPYILQATFLVAAWLTAGITQAMPAVMAVLFAILTEAEEKMGLEKNSKYTVLTGIGIAIACGLGIASVPWCYTLASFKGLISGSGLATDFNDLHFNLLHIAAFALLTIAILLLTKIVMGNKIDMEKFKSMELGTVKVSFTTQMGWAIGAIGVLLIGMMLPPLIKAENSVMSAIRLIGPAGSFALATIVMCIAPDGKTKGVGIFDFGKKMQASIEWSMMWNISIIMFLGGLMSNAELTGVSSFLGAIFSPLTQMNSTIAIMLLGVIACAVTNFMSNTIVMVIFSVLAIPICNGDPRLMAAASLAILLGANIAVAMPSASFTGTFLHSQGHMFKPKDLIVWGYIESMICVVIGMAVLALMIPVL